MANATLSAGDLTAVIGDNEAYDQHRAGYNGVHSLTHRTEKTNLFVPIVAGLNLEHIFDGDKELRDLQAGRKVFFEPRNHPMTLKKLSDTSVELHQAPTPTFKLESWTTFALSAPHYLDFTFRCKPTQHVFRYGYIGLFWASYINAPEDKSIYFRDQGRWQQLCTQQHNLHSTVCPREPKVDLKFTHGLADSLYQNFSPFSYDEPFYYGLYRNHVFLLMFALDKGLPDKSHIRFTHSPSGGGYNKELQTTNPAWDFQFILPTYEVLKEYGFRCRVVYRERCGRDEIRKEVAKWNAGA